VAEFGRRLMGLMDGLAKNQHLSLRMERQMPLLLGTKTSKKRHPPAMGKVALR
jgi:hypothetical protein